MTAGGRDGRIIAGEVLMRPWVAAAVAAVAAVVLASPSPAQSLAEVAARTKKKAEEDKTAKPAKAAAK